MNISAVIVAGGSGKRMQMNIKKQYILLEGKEILAHTIQAFQNCEDINEIIVVVGEEEISQVQEKIVKKYGFNKVTQIIGGGKERKDSVYNGLLATSKVCEYVMIHDGARPFITQNLLEKSIQSMLKYDAAIVAVPVKDTIKSVELETKTVESTPDRSKLWLVQTPQSFKKDLIMKAYEAAYKENWSVTDDSMLVEAYGHRVHVVKGAYTNIKITTPEDLIIGTAFLKAEINKKDIDI